MSAKIPPPSKEELAAQILSGMSGDELAVHYKCSRFTVNIWRRVYGLQGLARSGRRAIDMTDEELLGMIDSGLTKRQIAERAKCSMRVIEDRLHRLKVRARRQLRNEFGQPAVNVVPSAAAIFAANPFGLSHVCGALRHDFLPFANRADTPLATTVCADAQAQSVRERTDGQCFFYESGIADREGRNGR